MQDWQDGIGCRSARITGDPFHICACDQKPAWFRSIRIVKHGAHVPVRNVHLNVVSWSAALSAGRCCISSPG